MRHVYVCALCLLAAEGVLIVVIVVLLLSFNCCCHCLLQVIEQTKEIQGTTQVALADQREQMQRIETDLDKVRGAVQCSHFTSPHPTAVASAAGREGFRACLLLCCCCCMPSCCTHTTHKHTHHTSHNTRQRNATQHGRNTNSSNPADVTIAAGDSATMSNWLHQRHYCCCCCYCNLLHVMTTHSPLS